MSVRQHDDRRSWRVLQAALVLILCRDERSLPRSLRQRMLRWIQSSPQNLVHLFEIARVDYELDRLKLMDRSAQLAKSAPRPRGIPLLPRRALLIGAVAAIALAVTLSISNIGQREVPIRHVTLEDGSVMHLARGADVDIEFSEKVRLIELHRGEAVFEVAKETDRPFTVRSPWSDSIAVGTRFGVDTDAAASTTVVTEGQVRVVVPAGADQATGKMVRAGEQIRVAAGSAHPQTVMSVDADRRISWAAGWLEFAGEPVGEAVSVFNRYSDVRIDITQPALSNARLKYGRFELDKPESFAGAVAGALNAPMTLDPERNVIYIGEGQRKPK